MASAQASAGVNADAGRAGSDSGALTHGQEAGGDDASVEAAATAEGGTLDTGSPKDATAIGAYEASIFADSSGLVPVNEADAMASMNPGDGAVPMRGGGGDSTVCAQSLGWWVVGATLDPAVVAPNAASQLNPLLSAQHPLTLADFATAGGGMMLQVSGTLANGISQQYFPFQYPATPAPLVISSTGPLPTFAATAPTGATQTSAGFLHVVDSSMADVWIPLSNVSTTATAGDALCQSLTGGQVTGVIPSTAGATSMVIAGATTSVDQLFGSPTSTSPAGWTISLLFPSAKIVQVTFK
jgi:hypothetical protein